MDKVLQLRLEIKTLFIKQITLVQKSNTRPPQPYSPYLREKWWEKWGGMKVFNGKTILKPK